MVLPHSLRDEFYRLDPDCARRLQENAVPRLELKLPVALGAPTRPPNLRRAATHPRVQGSEPKMVGDSSLKGGK